MSDIRDKILREYDIDLEKENIFTLYKIDSVDLSSGELLEKIQETRSRWGKSVNSPNERIVARDRARLEKAEKYEAILQSEKLRKEAFAYYNPSFASGTKQGGGAGDSTQFAKEYFELIATTKTIDQRDVDFFFKYYRAERKNKKEIMEMLKKEMKLYLLKDGKDLADDDKELKGKKKDESSYVLVNLFQEATVLNLQRALEKYEEALRSREICLKYPEIMGGLYKFLNINTIKDAAEFRERMNSMGKEVYQLRQEKGAEYIPLVDMFNILQSIGEYQDVADNMEEFKLLLKYPTLTPYMYSFVEMKAKTIKGMVEIANREYAFKDDVDFILNYYQPIYDNFGISNNAIGALLRKAEKGAKMNKVINAIDEKLGRNKDGRRLPFSIEFIHCLIYWPVFVAYFVFELSRLIFTRLRHAAILVFILMFIWGYQFFPKLGAEKLTILLKIMHKKEWFSYLMGLDKAEHISGGFAFISTIFIVTGLLALYLLPPLFAAVITSKFADDFNKRFDWIGLKRSFQQLLIGIRKKTEERYFEQRQSFVGRQLSKIVINFLCLAILLGIILAIPFGFRKFSESTGYFQPEETESFTQFDTGNSGNIEFFTDAESGDTSVVLLSADSIRREASDSSEVLLDAGLGDSYIYTGANVQSEDGSDWYEVYINEERTETGWIKG